jgi:hypothetical protein
VPHARKTGPGCPWGTLLLAECLIFLVGVRAPWKTRPCMGHAGHAGSHFSNYSMMARLLGLGPSRLSSLLSNLGTVSLLSRHAARICPRSMLTTSAPCQGSLHSRHAPWSTLSQPFPRAKHAPRQRSIGLASFTDCPWAGPGVPRGPWNY